MGQESPGNGRAWQTVAVAVAIAISAGSLANGFAYDDIQVIAENSRVTTLSPPWTYFLQSYWPRGGLFRPLTVWLFAIEWQLGEGAPWIFHATSVALYGLATALVYRLARQALAPAWAGVAALLFAVHPVHVEAVANVVGQAELLCGVLVLAAVLCGVEGAARGPDLAHRLGVLVFGALAALSKEQGFVTPALLVACVVMLHRAAAPVSLKRIGPVVSALLALLLALLVLRAAVLGGLAGDQPAAPLRHLSPGARALVSLGTVPEWARLLVWPARLSFDYSPPGFRVASAPGAIHAVGTLLLGLAAWLAWRFRTRAPVLTLGILWTTISLLPISNLLVPTGILLAERTLYLASVGTVLAMAAAGALAHASLLRGWSRRVVPGITTAVVLLAAARSMMRVPVWHGNETLFRQVEIEAPNNYRAHRTLAIHLDRQGRLDEAANEYRRSIDLWGGDTEMYEGLAILLQRQGHEAEAAGILEKGLAVDPAGVTLRSKLYFIHAKQRNWEAARAVATAGIAPGDSTFVPLLRRADSALAATSDDPTRLQ